MSQHHPLDDASIEALLADPASDALLGGFVEDLRMAAKGPDPVPSAALAALLAHGAPADESPLPALQATGPTRRRWKTSAVPRFVAGLSLAGKVALGAGVATAAVTGAGAAGALPGPAQGAVANVVSTVTPFSFPERASTGTDFGGGVSNDAPDGGVDGAQVSGRARDLFKPKDRGAPAGPDASIAPGTPPVSAPPVSTPPGGTPPISTPPVSTPSVDGAPASVPPVSAPPVSAPPVSAPPVSAPPVSAPPVSAPLGGQP